MRKSLKFLAPLTLIALSACSQESDEAASTQIAEVSADLAEPSLEAAVSPPAGESAALAERADIPVSLPKMAYVLDYGFRLASDAIAPLQQKHADMCEGLGPYNCQIVSLSRSGEEDDDVRGELQLAVVADQARSFGTLLAAAAEASGAESFKANIQGEDLSKSIVDTEARVRSRIALRDRLLEVVKTRKGTVQELVEAERGVAAVNEEIDQAQSWLKEQKGRVAYSRMTISYESATPGGAFLQPIKGALGSLGGIFGILVAALILALAVLGPFVLGALGIRRWQRRTGEATVEA